MVGRACRLAMSVLLSEREKILDELSEVSLSPDIMSTGVVEVRLYVAANTVIKPSNIIGVRILLREGELKLLYRMKAQWKAES